MPWAALLTTFCPDCSASFSSAEHLPSKHPSSSGPSVAYACDDRFVAKRYHQQRVPPLLVQDVGDSCSDRVEALRLERTLFFHSSSLVFFCFFNGRRSSKTRKSVNGWPPEIRGKIVLFPPRRSPQLLSGCAGFDRTELSFTARFYRHLGALVPIR